MAWKLIVCSLMTSAPQAIPPNTYTILKFPFDNESADAPSLHDPKQPDTGLTTTASNPRSGLIWPAHVGWAHLNGLIYWQGGDYTEVRDRFVRDPLELTTGYDSTCTEDHAKTPGGQYLAKNWDMFVHPLTSVGLLVQHNGSRSVKVDFAEFKMSYWVDL